MILSAIGLVGSAAASYAYYKSRPPTDLPEWTEFEYVDLTDSVSV
jgi:hypothetical protein